MNRSSTISGKGKFTSSKQPKKSAPANEGKSELVNQFVDVIYRLVCALCEIFDDCPVLAEHKQNMESGLLLLEVAKKTMIVEWHKQVSPYYDAVDNNNLRVLKSTQIPLWKEMKLTEKLKEIEDDEQSIKNLLQYLKKANYYSRMYNQMPINILNKIESATSTIQESIKSGQPNIEDVMKIGERIVSEASEEDIGQLIQNMGSVMQNITSQKEEIDKLNEQAPEFVPQINKISDILNNPVMQKEIKEVFKNPTPTHQSETTEEKVKKSLTTGYKPSKKK